jgi:uncharacterized protein
MRPPKAEARGRREEGVPQQDSLAGIVAATPWLMRALRAVRSVGPAGACIGAGAVRSAVWDSLHGYPQASPAADMDVAYFEPSDISRQADAAYERRLAGVEPDLRWEVVNQAGVHVWYETAFGKAVPPLRSLEEGVASWPETATAVAVWLGDDDRVGVIAPLGLEDLFDCVIRRNPARASVRTFRARVEAKGYSERWPRVRVVWE